MMKSRVVPCLLAAAAACAAALLLWALAVRFPGPLTRALSPVQVSPWEMGKAAFFPLLAASPLLWRLEKGGSRGGLCLMALAGAVLALALTYAPVPPAAVAAMAIGGAAAHNIGQMAAAVITLGSTMVLGYLPFLLAVSLFTGALTGFITALLLRATRHIRFH